MQCYVHWKLVILHQSSHPAVSPTDLLQEKQEELWLALAPRGLSDWLGCCYLVERGAPFPSQARWPPTVSIASLTTYTFTLASSVKSYCAMMAKQPLLRVTAAPTSVLSV